MVSILSQPSVPNCQINLQSETPMCHQLTRLCLGVDVFMMLQFKVEIYDIKQSHKSGVSNTRRSSMAEEMLVLEPGDHHRTERSKVRNFHWLYEPWPVIGSYLLNTLVCFSCVFSASSRCMNAKGSVYIAAEMTTQTH